jgi:hypothetical protein
MAAAKSSGQKARSSQAGARSTPARGDGLTALTEQMANRIIKPLGLVVLSRERIRETLDEAAEQGRITRRDAEELFLTLVQRANESLDLLVRGADRARRTMRIGPSFPIRGYDELGVGQVQKRLSGLSAADLRKVRDYERRHGNRKSVLSAIDKALD